MKVYQRLSFRICILEKNDVITTSGEDGVVKFNSDWLDQYGGFGA